MIVDNIMIIPTCLLVWHIMFQAFRLLVVLALSKDKKSENEGNRLSAAPASKRSPRSFNQRLELLKPE
jgi:hypothetical protein